MPVSSCIYRFVSGQPTEPRHPINHQVGLLSRLWSHIHYYLGRCRYCHWRKATWFYAPGLTIACDKCVPRGCSCNQNEDGTYDLDEEGRRWPCCEWMTLRD